MVSLLSSLKKEAATKDKAYELFLSFLTYMFYKTERIYLANNYKANGGVKGGKLSN